MAYQSPKIFNETLLAFLEENDLKQSFRQWLEWDAGASIITQTTMEALTEDYQIALSQGFDEDYLKQTRRLQENLVSRLNSSSSPEANRMVELELKAVTEWLRKVTASI